MDLILDPHTGDTESADDILDELYQIMRKRGCCLIAREGGFFVLAKVAKGLGHQARALVEVKQITPDLIESRPIDWSKKPGLVQ